MTGLKARKLRKGDMIRVLRGAWIKGARLAVAESVDCMVDETTEYGIVYVTPLEAYRSQWVRAKWIVGREKKR